MDVFINHLCGTPTMVAHSVVAFRHSSISYFTLIILAHTRQHMKHTSTISYTDLRYISILTQNGDKSAETIRTETSCDGQKFYFK